MQSWQGKPGSVEHPEGGNLRLRCAHHQAQSVSQQLDLHWWARVGLEFLNVIDVQGVEGLLGCQVHRVHLLHNNNDK